MEYALLMSDYEKDHYFGFLKDLREEGDTNMATEAVIKLKDEFDLAYKDALSVLTLWSTTLKRNN